MAIAPHCATTAHSSSAGLAWAVTHGATTVAQTDQELAEELRLHGVAMYDWLRRLPWREESPLSGLPGYDLWAREIYERGDEVSKDGFWQQPGLNFEANFDRTADVPTVYSGGWYDSYARATTDNFRQPREQTPSPTASHGTLDARQRDARTVLRRRGGAGPGRCHELERRDVPGRKFAG